ncbi:hypothetical protein HYH03_001306 [Edaphochlamys debaryana]|uniref:Malic enzyme n=1 Tax=Edaphochlamys debaryana TaxID=47281 RepID=A0A836C644_9CHLO|nr:hypothetical protein HYH03_001306 [Edaphochlamys debaryana]|eukprot:KAG2500529.1 hypothetical protein HYH03_001306 [Edaphochlamys debaryana]
MGQHSMLQLWREVNMPAHSRTTHRLRCHSRARGAAPRLRHVFLRAEKGGAEVATAPGPHVPASRRQLLQGAAVLTGGLAAAVTGTAPAAAADLPAAAAGTPAPSPVPTACPPVASGSGTRAWRALRDPTLNRGLATPASARHLYGLDGLLPSAVTAPEQEVARAEAAVARAAGCPLMQYSLLMGLREADPGTFFALVQRDVERYLPLIYTPTVGDACLAWGSLLPRPTGLSISLEQAGRAGELVANWAEGQPQAKIAVITDGERILGLGDLGAHGMGIPTGKAAVYGAAGVDPSWVVPVALDVGCDTAAVVNDPLYVGLRRPRERGEAYYALVDEVVGALRARYGPGLLVHWEDVGFSHAFPLLERLGAAGVPSFNDDIQATAAVTVAALLGAERLPGVPPLEQQRFLFFGAGQANLGVASLLVAELVARGLGRREAEGRVWLVDRRGLVTDDRPDLSGGKARFAQPRPRGLAATASAPAAGPKGARPSGSEVAPGLVEVVGAVRPTALIGAATVGGAFSPEVLQTLTKVQPSASSRPLVFALSNPTSAAECTFEQARRWTSGRAVFASGTQFPSLQDGGRTLTPAQANNCFVFPGIGAGCVASGAGAVSEGMLLAAARAVAALASSEDLAAECVLPRVGRLGECRERVAAEVTRAALAEGAAAGVAARGNWGGRSWAAA